MHVGSRNEGTGTTGLAHFFEHMMFNGTSNRPQGDFDQLLEAQGGSNNAYTSQDVTVYQDWFPSSALEMVLDLESDRLANLALLPEVVENERKVVYLRASPGSKIATRRCSRSRCRRWRSWPIRTGFRPSAGRRIFNPGRHGDPQNFYRSYYAPNNCTLILAGALEPDAVFALAHKYFASIPARSRHRRCVPASPSSSASGGWCSSAPDRIRCCNTPITRSPRAIRSSRP